MITNYGKRKVGAEKTEVRLDDMFVGFCRQQRIDSGGCATVHK